MNFNDELAILFFFYFYLIFPVEKLVNNAYAFNRTNNTSERKRQRLLYITKLSRVSIINIVSLLKPVLI